MSESETADRPLRRLIGADRRARIVTALTALAAVVAVAGFIALSAADDSIPRDGYTLSADRICLNAKSQIVDAANGPGDFARDLVPIVVRWREELAELDPPADRVGEVAQLDDALREMEIEAATLARASEGQDRALVLAAAEAAEAASGDVESAVASLGLSECAAARIGFNPAQR
jgi:hypothetical protein